MKSLSTLLLFYLFIPYSFGQIVIQRNDLPIINDTLRVTNVDLTGVNYTLTGENYFWDFSSINSKDEEVMEYKAALQTDYLLYFLGLTYFGLKGEDLTIGGYGLKDIYNFYEIDNSKYGIKGIGVKFQDAPFAAVYSKLDKIFSLPLRFGQKDSNQYAFKVDIPSLGSYKGDGTRVTTVDGWGKVMTPYGTFDCLRTHSVVKGTDSILANIFGINIKFGLPVEKAEYQWWAKGQKVPVMSVEGRLVAGVLIPTKVYYKGVNKQVPTSIQTPLADMEWHVYSQGDRGWQVEVPAHCVGGVLKVYQIDGKLSKSQVLTQQSSRVEVDTKSNLLLFVYETTEGLSVKKVMATR